MNILSPIYRTAFLSAAFSTLSLIGAAQVVAGDLLSEPVSVRVSYADLDITTTAGATALHRRIKSAAKEVCGYEGTSLVEMDLWQRCVQGAVDDAVASVNSPLLAAVHSGKPVPTTATAMLIK
jgi:UrcA family protein